MIYNRLYPAVGDQSFNVVSFEMLTTVRELLFISRPMNKIQVEIVKLKISKRFLKSGNGLVISSLGVPQLTCNKQAASVISRFLYSLTNALFIAINSSTVKMSISSFFAVCPMLLL